MKVMELDDIDYSQPPIEKCIQYKSTDDTKIKVIQLLEEYPPPDLNNKYACYKIYGESSYCDIARSVEFDVFREAFGDGPELMDQEYQNYEQHSVFFLVIDREDCCAAGALRIIKNSNAGLKTLADISHAPLSITLENFISYYKIDNMDACWDIATAVVLKKYRAHAYKLKVSIYLYHILYKQSIKNNIHHHVSIMDKHIHTHLTRILAMPYTPIMNSSCFSYLGSESSLAVYGKTSEFRPSVDSHIDSLSPRAFRTLGPYFDCLLLGDDVPSLQEVGS